MMVRVRTIVNHRMVLDLLVRNILLMLIIIIISIIICMCLLLLILLLVIHCLCVSRDVFSLLFFICVM